MCGPTDVDDVPLTTAAATVEVPKSGLETGPTRTKSVPVYVYNCLAAESHQKSPFASPEGAVALTSAPPAILNFEPS